MTDDEWRGVLVVGELNEEALRTCTLELLAKAREITDQLGGRLTCVLIGDTGEGVAENAVHHGADRVIVADTTHDGFQAGPLVQPVARLIEEARPEIVLLSATDMGRDLAPMLGARLDTGVANECVDLDLDVSERTLLAKRHVFGGQLEETLTTPGARPQIASLQPGAAREGFPDETRFGDTETVDASLGKGADVVSQSEGDRPSLANAEVVVVGGRGVAKEDWGAVDALAESLGGAIGATRGAVHGDRADEALLVDATATHIQPRLYVGVGVSGTFEHVKAVEEAEWLVAIARSEEAALIRRADWGLVGDPAAIARSLASKAQERRS